MKIVERLGCHQITYEADTAEEMADLMLAADHARRECERRRSMEFGKDIYVVQDVVPVVGPNTRRRT